MLTRIFFRGTVFVKLLDYVGTLGKVIVKNGPELFLYVVKSNSSGNVKVTFDLAFCGIPKSPYSIPSLSLISLKTIRY